MIRLDIHAAKKQLWPTTCDQSCARLKYFNQRAGHSALAEGAAGFSSSSMAKWRTHGELTYESIRLCSLTSVHPHVLPAGASQFQGGLWSEYSLRTWRNSGMDTRKLWYNVHESQCLASGPSDNPKRIKLVRTGCRAWHTTGGGAVGYSRAGRSRSCYEKIPARLHGFCECEDGRLVLLAPPDGRGGRGALEGVAVGPNRERYQTCHDACTIGVPSVSVVDNAKGASLLPAFERAGCLHFQGTYEGKRYALRSPGAKLHCDEPLFFGYSSGHCACEGGFAGFQAAHEGFDPTRVPGTCRQACAMWARPPGVSIVDCPGLMPGAGKCNVLDRSHVDEVLRTALGGPPMAASVAGPAVTLPDPDQVALLSRAWEESHTGHWIFPRAVRLEGRETKVRYSRTEITEIRQRYRIWMSHVAGTTAGLGRDLDGQGIVTAARGPQEMLAVAGMLRNLRLLGCTLPVEVVVQHGDVPSVALAEDLAALGARAVDLDATLWYMLHPHPASLYAWAVLASSFEEILWMSPEVVPLQDPTSLFRDRKYQDAGLLLWQDVWAPSQLADMWHIMELDASSKAALPLTRGTFAGTHFMLNLRQRWTTVLSWAWTAQPGVLPLLSGPIRSGSQEALAVAAAMSGEPFALADPRPATVGAPTDSLFLDHAGTLHFHPTANSPLFIVDAAPAWMGEYPLRRELLRVRWRVVRQCEEVLPVPSGVGARDAIITGCETQPHELEDMMRRAGFRHDAESVHWAAMLEAQCMPGVSAALSAAAHRTGVSGFGDDGAMRKCADVWAAVGTMGDELPFSRPFCSVRRKDNKRMEERPWQPWTVHATVRNGTVTNDSIT